MKKLTELFPIIKSLPAKQELPCAGCEELECQECCEHDDIESFMCLACGKEFEPSDLFDEDYGQER